LLIFAKEKKIPAMTDQINARHTVDLRYTSSPSSIEQAQRATSHTNNYYENHYYQKQYRERVIFIFERQK